MHLSTNEHHINLPDSEIWNLFRNGSDWAFDLIYQTHFDRLYNYGCQFTPDHGMVEDVIQELFLELRRRAKHLSPTDKILPYLYSSFRRKIIRVRDKARKSQEFEPSVSTTFSISIEESILENELSDERKQHLSKALSEISEKHREIIYQFYYENLSYDEIRQIMGFDHVKSVRNLLYKALKAIRGRIDLTTMMILIQVLIIKNE